jgi:hypothetical protein
MTPARIISVALLGFLLVLGCTSRPDGISAVTVSESPAAPSTQDPDQLQEVTVCQLTQDPGKYNHALVKVSGFFSHGFEDSALFDPTCESRFRLWFEYGGTNVTGTMYCCGLTAARQRPQQISVENIPIPLLVDDNFKTLDNLLHTPADSIVHATAIGRFFSGQKTTVPGGSDHWMGYGHMGCCSLLMVQQVVETDAHNRSDLDYRASPDQPDLSKSGCGYRDLMELEPFEMHLEMQRQAEQGSRSWAFDDPRRVATDVLATLTKRPLESINNLTIKRQMQSRILFEWRPKREKKVYMVVLSRPYQLSFYAKSNLVAWVPLAAYESSCE